MAISGIQNIDIGLPNESANSDSLYTAFTKTVTNFNTLFACASPYNTFTGANGILTSADANTNTITRLPPTYALRVCVSTNLMDGKLFVKFYFQTPISDR